MSNRLGSSTFLGLMLLLLTACGGSSSHQTFVEGIYRGNLDYKGPCASVTEYLLKQQTQLQIASSSTAITVSRLDNTAGNVVPTQLAVLPASSEEVSVVEDVRFSYDPPFTIDSLCTGSRTTQFVADTAGIDVTGSYMLSCTSGRGDFDCAVNESGSLIR